MLPVASSGVEAWADHIQLTLPEADRERLRKLSDVRKNKDFWQQESDHQLRKHDYLKEALGSTGNAVTWWLAQEDNDVRHRAPPQRVRPALRRSQRHDSA